MQEYAIELDEEWLKQTTVRRFMSLVNGLTKRSSLGQKITAEYMKKHNPAQMNNKKALSSSFDLKSDDGINKFHDFAKIFKKE